MIVRDFMLKGVIFDMDGLMFDSEKLYYQANLAAAKVMGLGYPDDYYERFIGASDEDLMGFFAAAFGGQAQMERFMQLTYDKINTFVKAGKLVKKPGLDNLLAFLDQVHLQKIIASSNYQDKIDAFLTSGQIRHEFPKIVSMDDVTQGKPAPDLFLKAAAKLNLPKDQLVILEDSANGFQAAQNADIRCIIVPDIVPPTAEIKANAWQVLPDLNAVQDFLKTQLV
jgi:HAD superfamily hydrolase (TIGR01509 family)